MEENNTTTTTTTTEQNNGVVTPQEDYLEVIKQMKQNSVSREQYDEIRNENKKLLETIVNGNGLEGKVEEKPEEPVDLNELRKDLFDGDNNNLDFVSKSLKLRDEVMKRGGVDPFLPWGQNISPTQDDIETAERVATIFKECVDYANGDSEVFTNELQRRTNDVRIPRKY